MAAKKSNLLSAGLFCANRFTLCCERPFDIHDATRHPLRRQDRDWNATKAAMWEKGYRGGLCLTEVTSFRVQAGGRFGNKVSVERPTEEINWVAIIQYMPHVLLAAIPFWEPGIPERDKVDVWFDHPRGVLDLVQWPEGFRPPTTLDDLRIAADWHEERGNSERRDTFRKWADGAFSVWP